MNKMMKPYQAQTQVNNSTGLVSVTLLGALVSAAVKTTINYKKVKDEKMTKEQAIKEVAKSAAQGAVAAATVSSMHSSIHAPVPSPLSAVTYATMGIAGIYAIEKFYEKPEEIVSEPATN